MGLALWLACLSAAQVFAKDASGVPPEMRHQSWSVVASTGGHMDNMRGLPQVSARAITEGPRGLIWVGTENGIARLDGRDFDVFNSRNTPELTSAWIDALYTDASQRVWVATSDGVLVVSDQGFTRIHQADKGFQGRRFAQTADGTLWLGGSRLWSVDDAALQIAPFHSGGVVDLLPVGESLWVVDEQKQVVIYHAAKERLVLDASLWAGQEVRRLLWFDGVPHVLTKDSVFMLSVQRGEWMGKELPLPTQASLVTGAAGKDLVVLDSDGSLHVLASEQAGRNQLPAGSVEGHRGGVWVTPVLPQQVPIDPSPVAMLVDSNHSVWVGLITGGLHHYWSSVMTREAPGQAIAKAKVWSFFVGDTVYAVTDDGIYRRRGDASWHLDIPVEDLGDVRPYSFWQGDSGQYLGTRSGLYWRAAAGESFAPIAALGDRQINSLMLHDDALYIATGSGLFLYTPDSRSLTPVPGVGESAVRTVLPTADGDLWVGTQSGLLILNAAGVAQRVDATLDVAFVTGVVELAPGWFAVSSYGRGLFVRSPEGEWRHYHVGSGLAFEDFFGLVAEGRWLWASAASGLMRFDVQALLRGEARADVLLRDDGIHAGRSRLRCCNGAGERRSVVFDDQLFLPTLEGVLTVSLNASSAGARVPLIKAVWRQNERLPASEHYRLGEDQRDIELAFTVPHFGSDNLPEFRYRLTPMDEDWFYAGDRKVAFFTNLPSGKSTFELQSRVGASDWLSAPGVTIEVQRHLHETWYMRLLMSITAVLLIWGLMGYRTNQLHKRAVLLKRAVAERTAEAEAASRAMLETARDSQRLVREANAPIVTVAENGSIIDWNLSAEKLTGWRADDVIGTNIETLLSDARPKIDVRGLFAELRKGGTVDGLRLTFSNRSGRRIVILLGGTLLPAFNDVAERFVLVGQDLTDYLQREQELIQASKMATLGEMATGMAHELNQPLNAIKLAATNMARKLEKAPDDTSTLPEKLQRISDQVERARKIIDHLRLYGRRSGTADGVTQTEFDPQIPITDALSMFREQLSLESVTLRETLSCEGCLVLGDPLLLEQVVINLLGNSRDAIRDHCGPGDARFIDVRATVVGARLFIDVEDSGGGVSEETLLNMFQPFYTTKPPGKGTGLGLSISYGSIRNMSGDITARSGELGLIVSIELPVLPRERADIEGQ